MARDTVAAAADRYRQVSFAGEPHGRDDVRGIQGTHTTSGRRSTIPLNVTRAPS
jgi:hypothetical protein